MKLLILSLIATTALIGCQTPGPSYDDAMNTWIGSTTENLVRQWGPPANEYKTGDYKFLTYETAGGNVVLPIGGMWAAVPRSCRTTFQINSIDMVMSYSYQGNACR